MCVVIAKMKFCIACLQERLQMRGEVNVCMIYNNVMVLPDFAQDKLHIKKNNYTEISLIINKKIVYIYFKINYCNTCIINNLHF
jgi:molybdenum cofactor biosynthesis enzyme MoaA